MPNTNPVVVLLADGMARNGYSGLISPDGGCRCRIDNLVECRGDPSHCEPGQVHVNPKQPTDWTVRRGLAKTQADASDQDDYDEPECERCGGDGRDPWNDYLMPCPLCQGEQH